MKKEKLLNWIEAYESVRDKNNTCYDIHIYEINPEYKIKDRWIEGGIKLFINADKIIKDLKLPFLIDLSFLLVPSKNERDINFKNIIELKSQLSSQPPSLYLKPKDWNRLESVLKKSINLNDRIFIKEANTFYKEFYNEDEHHYDRWFYLLSKF